jgi:hypothetical protein
MKIERDNVERERRKRNVVIRDVPEPQGATNSEKRAADIETVSIS